MKKLICLLILVSVFLGCSVETDALEATGETEGELFIYDKATEIGIAARRVFTDSSGKDTKEIYYGHKPKIDGPFKEDDLIARFIKFYKYDERGRRIEEEEYSLDMKLLRRWVITYETDSVMKARTLFNEKDVKTYEIIYDPNGRTKSHLYFDENGEKLVAIRGDIPKDGGLPYGWGKPNDGLLCGIAPNRLRATSIKDFKFGVSIRNQSNEAKKVVQGNPYTIMKLELRDNNGVLVPQRMKYIEERKEKLRRINRWGRDNPEYSFLDKVEPQKAWALYSGYELGEWYDDIPPDKYFLTIRCRTSDEEFSLISNTIAIEVLGKK